jgi:hypothetical protein
MNFKLTFLVIIALLSALVDSSSSETEFDVNCDSFFIESEDSFLERFIIKHGLQEYYERRNENYEVCLQFLEKFFALIDEYRTESKLNDDYIESHKNKRAYKKPRNRFSFKY